VSPTIKARKIADRIAKKLEKNKAAKLKKEENAKAKGKVWNPSTKRWVSEATLKKHQEKFTFKPFGTADQNSPIFQKKFNIPKKPLYSKPPGGRRIQFNPDTNVREINNRFTSYRTPSVPRPFPTGTFSRNKLTPNVDNPRFMQSRYVNKFTERQSRVKHASNNLEKQQSKLERAQRNKNGVQQQILRATNNAQKTILIRKKNEINAYINQSKSRITNLKEKVKAESNRLYAHSTIGRGL